MATNSIHDSNSKKIERWSKFQLPNRFKRIGSIICITTLLLMLGRKFADGPLWIKPLLSNIFIIGLLMVSLAKEKIEDELIVKLRSQSYRLGFTFGVVYAILVIPLINYMVDLLVSSAEEAAFEASVFEVLISMLAIQLLFFHKFKRAHP